MKRDTRQAYRRRAADTERMVDAAVADVKANRDADLAARKAYRAQLRSDWAAMGAVPADRLKPGMRVANRRGFAATVVRVNPTSATVDHGDGIHSRWPLDSIIGAMEAGK